MMIRLKYLLLVLCFAPFLNGCLYMQNQSRSYSSIAAFLYPAKTQSSADIEEKPSVPNLNIPMKVGIAFVPESCGTYKRFNIDENLKTELMESIAQEFKKREFINKIEIIPSSYLQRKGSFSNLEKVKKIFDVDVVVLLSYDQVQYTDQSFLSLVYYYTVVGRYVFNGDQNDTVTLIDATVYDIKSKKLLFRAPGNSQIKGDAKRAYLNEELRKDSHEGFKVATLSTISNLDKELENFRRKIREKKAEVKITYSRGYSGGGYNNIVSVVTMLLLLGFIVLRKRSGLSAQL